RGGRRAIRRHRRRRLGVTRHQSPPGRGAGAGRRARARAQRGGLMPLWRRRREGPEIDPTQVAEEPETVAVEAELVEPEPGVVESGPEAAELLRAAEPPPGQEPDATPAYAPFDPTAFLAVA